MCDGSPAELTWSVSHNGIHFTKSHHNFTLSIPYHAASARDPKVFVGTDSLFHMLVTTSLDTDGNKGCLAHAASHNLTEWEQREPVTVWENEDQHECSDYFYKDGYYYLIYSIAGMAHYFLSENPFGPWRAPENNIIVDDMYRVPKAAFWKENRIIFAGFRYDTGVRYGGTVHFYEAKQQKGGSLAFNDVREISKDYNNSWDRHRNNILPWQSQ